MTDTVQRETGSNKSDESHLAFFYKTDEEHRTMLTRFLKNGIEKDEKIIYVSDTSPPDSILDYLRCAGLDGHRCQESGQLKILEARDTFLPEGEFDPGKMIAVLEAETIAARDEGYAALRITGEMTWALGAVPGSDRLIEYEFKLNDAPTEGRCVKLCQYDLRRFPSSVLLYVLTAHPVVFVGTKPFVNTFYGIMPSYRGHGSASSTLRTWLNHLT